MTNRPSIGGALNYEALAMLHRPSSQQLIQSEIQRLHGNGWTSLDISAALRIPHDEVVNALGKAAHHE